MVSLSCTKFFSPLKCLVEVFFGFCKNSNRKMTKLSAIPTIMMIKSETNLVSPSGCPWFVVSKHFCSEYWFFLWFSTENKPNSCLVLMKCLKYFVNGECFLIAGDAVNKGVGLVHTTSNWKKNEMKNNYSSVANFVVWIHDFLYSLYNGIDSNLGHTTLCQNKPY